MASYVRMTMLGVALIGATAGAVWAQMPPPRPAPGVERPAGEATPTTTGVVEGTVKKIDPAARTVRVSTGLFGFLGKTLEIVPDTRITVDGRDANLSEVREGAKVKAFYETRSGRTIATQIEAIPSEQTSSRRS